MILFASRVECGTCFCTLKKGHTVHLDYFINSAGLQVVYGKCSLCHTYGKQILDGVNLDEHKRLNKNNYTHRVRRS